MKRQFILKTPYPNSPPNHTIVTYDEERMLYVYEEKNVNHFILPSIVEQYSNWSSFSRKNLNIPMGSFVIFPSNIPKYASAGILEIVDIAISPMFQRVILTTNPISTIRSKSTRYIDVVIMNNIKNLQVFETLEEAEEYLILNSPLLSISDIATIYKSAVNPDYTQYTQLQELIKSKL